MTAIPDSNVVSSNVANLEEYPSFSATVLTPFFAYNLNMYPVRGNKLVTVTLVCEKCPCLGRKSTSVPQS